MKGAAGPNRSRRVALCRICVRHALLAGALALAMPAGAVETSILLSPAPADGAEMAYAVSVDGTRVALGAPGEDAAAGAIYVVDCVALPCAVPLRIAPQDLVAGNAFGAAVDMNGATLVATAIGPEPGAAYVFVGNGSGGWTQQARLTPTGGAADERFGISASISGDRLAIGADRANGLEGAVYVFARSGTAWTQEARLAASDPAVRAAFGSGVALDGDTLLVGAPLKAHAALGSFANGAAYVFTRGAGGWTQQSKLTDPNGANGDLFGFAVDLSGDRAVIGAPYATSAQGHAFVYSRSGTAWSQQAQLAATAGASGDEFGWSVALGGEEIMVGAPFAGQLTESACGGSYVFDITQLAENGTGSIEAPLPNELSGWSIAASGSRWVSAAPGHLVGAAVHAGAAYWFDPVITVFHANFDTSGACAPPIETPKA